MARSLTIKHEETATTSPLFTGFLLLSVGWLLAGALTSGDAQAQSDASVIDPGPSVQAPVVP
jgi:hypothetical protein